jgi:Fic family protein
MTKYIYDHESWPQFHWDENKISPQLAATRHRQGRFIGRMENLGFELKAESILQSLTQDVVKTSEIEGETLNKDQVRSSIARRLGIDIGALIPADRHVEGIVDLMLDATQNYNAPLTVERLHNWHASLFPTDGGGLSRITIGAWRKDTAGAMQVISGAIGHEHIHFLAPNANKLNTEIHSFLKWFNSETNIDPVIKAALAHLWFITIHPFEDGNGRIARAITDMCLARSEGSAQRFYSMSAQIRIERNEYYNILEHTQKDTLDITSWLSWFLDCLNRAFNGAENTLRSVLYKARFWELHVDENFSTRQSTMLNRLLDGFYGKLTTSKWAKLTNCSQDTALRDIDDLIKRGVLVKETDGGRNTSYKMVDNLIEK